MLKEEVDLHTCKYGSFGCSWNPKTPFMETPGFQEDKTGGANISLASHVESHSAKEYQPHTLVECTSKWGAFHINEAVWRSAFVDNEQSLSA